MANISLPSAMLVDLFIELTTELDLHYSSETIHSTGHSMRILDDFAALLTEHDVQVPEVYTHLRKRFLLGGGTFYY